MPQRMVACGPPRAFLPLGVSSGARSVTVPGPAGTSGFGGSGAGLLKAAVFAAFSRPTDGGLPSPEGLALSEAAAAATAGGGLSWVPSMLAKLAGPASSVCSSGGRTRRRQPPHEPGSPRGPGALD